MLNIEIIKNTNAEKSLDNALRMLYEDYKKDGTKGFTGARVKEVCETVNGKNLDEFWSKYINGTDDLPLDSYFNLCGLEITNENDTAQNAFDIESRSVNGKFIIAKVFAGGTAYESGLNSGDEIIAVNGTRTDEASLKTILKNYSEGNELKVLISRNGIIKEIDVKLLKPIPKFKIKESDEKTDEQKLYLDKWILG
jgi:predicted metalloprotease with PDZ domain